LIVITISIETSKQLWIFKNEETISTSLQIEEIDVGVG
jgi:hypothetical protein